MAEKSCCTGRSVNVGKNERRLSMAGGSALLAAGMVQAKKKNLLGALALAAGGAALVYRGATGHCAMYGVLGISTASATPLTAAITVNKPRDEVYSFWRDLRNLPRAVQGLDRVQVVDDRRSRWQVSPPGMPAQEWEAEITDEGTGEYISWRTVSGGPEHSGRVAFRDAPGGRGTEIAVSLSGPPRGTARALVMAAPLAEWGIEEALARVRQLLETGELATPAMRPEGGDA